MIEEEYIYEKPIEAEKNVEYIYKKPIETKKSYKKLIGVLVLIVIIILAAYFLYTDKRDEDIENQISNWTYLIENLTDNLTENWTYTVEEQNYFIIDDQTYTIPSEHTGVEALNYVRNNYSTDLAWAETLCINQFNGEWIDNSEKIGCYDMKGFFILYCNTENIMNILNFCHSIGGYSLCSSTQVSCTLY